MYKCIVFAFTGQNKDHSALVHEVQQVLEYCRKMSKMADDEDLVPGLGHFSIQGGSLASDGRSREVCKMKYDCLLAFSQIP